MSSSEQTHMELPWKIVHEDSERLPMIFPCTSMAAGVHLIFGRVVEKLSICNYEQKKNEDGDDKFDVHFGDLGLQEARMEEEEEEEENFLCWSIKQEKCRVRSDIHNESREYNERTIS